MSEFVFNDLIKERGLLVTSNWL